MRKIALMLAAVFMAALMASIITGGVFVLGFIADAIPEALNSAYYR